MSLLTDAARSLRGARRIEWILLVALAAVALLLLTGNRQTATDAKTTDELRMERVLSRIEGAGKVSVMISDDETGRVRGVLVVAEGASDIGTCLEIQRAVRAVSGADITDIEIVEMEGN